MKWIYSSKKSGSKGRFLKLIPIFEHYTFKKNVMRIDIQIIEKTYNEAIQSNSEREILKLIKDNSFLLSEIYDRQFRICPPFREVNFGGKHKCDFTWLNDNSVGPEWVLVEIEKPKVKLFTKKNEPAVELNHAIEQVRSWDRYFSENPSEKSRVFGAVKNFRKVLVIGTAKQWKNENAAKWRLHFNNNNDIEIRSYGVFDRAISAVKKELYITNGFEEYPKTKSHKELEKFWKEYGYMDDFRKKI